MKVVSLKKAKRFEPHEAWQRISLCEEQDVSVEHFTKPPNHASPVHSHSCAQVLVLLEGRVGVTCGSGEEVVLEAGDAVYIPGNEEHVVCNLNDSRSVGLDIFVPGRSFDFWKERLKPGK